MCVVTDPYSSMQFTRRARSRMHQTGIGVTRPLTAIFRIEIRQENPARTHSTIPQCQFSGTKLSATKNFGPDDKTPLHFAGALIDSRLVGCAVTLRLRVPPSASHLP